MNWRCIRGYTPFFIVVESEVFIVKKKQASPVVATEVQITNWDDWFQNCGVLVGMLQSYEDEMQLYYNTQNSKTPEGHNRAVSGFQSRHKKGFYQKNTSLPLWKMKRIFLIGISGFVASFLISLIVCLVRSIPLDKTSLLVCCLISVLLGFFVGCIPTSLHKNKLKKICGNMKALEIEMEPRICYLPPKYRNSQAASTFYDLWSTYGVVTFNQAVQACDDYLISNNLVGAFMAVMFDVPYKNAGLAQENQENERTQRGLYKDNNKPQDPNLPEDIYSKTYTGMDNADEVLQELVGLDNVKTQVQQMKNRMHFYSGMSAERISGNHMVFLGPPGTGKTTIARILTKILYDFGYIKENKCVEIDGGYMKSPYVGQTTERASAILRYALGGVLFIDEAYMMMDDKNGGSAGMEAMGVLLKAMEDNKNDFVVIFAGYEDSVNRLLASNDGFASRIKYKLYFDNFSVEELGQIFYLMLSQYTQNGGYSIDEDAMKLLLAHFEKERHIAGFGNARVVRNALDSILDNHADHYMKQELPEDKKFVITLYDVESYVGVRQKQMVEDGRNFIASKNLDTTIVSLQELKSKTKEGSTNPDADLERLTGLQIVKDEIVRMKAQFEFYDGKIESEGNHMVFVGPPGTGKTTVASIMTGYLYQMGLIQENSYLDVNGDFLRGMYVGHTGKRTEAVVQYSQGMVLFIDEAYLLATNDGQSDSFGQEAVGVLLDAMEKYRKNFVVIFAGYEKEMDDFLNVNSGLRSRISLEFHFTSYTPHELAQMFKNIAKQNRFKVERNVWIPLQKYFQTQLQNPRFSNGRFVRSFFEKAKKQHIMNYSQKMYGEEQKYVLTLQDLLPLFEETTENDM